MKIELTPELEELRGDARAAAFVAGESQARTLEEQIRALGGDDAHRQDSFRAAFIDPCSAHGPWETGR